MKFRYGQNWQKIRVKAQVVAEELNNIIEANNGAIIPDTVVRAARPKRSKLHTCFEWDDKAAAHQWRIQQAKQLLCSIVVVQETGNAKSPVIEVRAFPNIETDGGNYYTTMARVAKDDEVAEQYENQILRELQYLRKKHKAYQRFRGVWTAVDSLSK